MPPSQIHRTKLHTHRVAIQTVPDQPIEIQHHAENQPFLNAIQTPAQSDKTAGSQMDRHTNIQIVVPSDRLHERKKPDFSPTSMTGRNAATIATWNTFLPADHGLSPRYALCAGHLAKSPECCMILRFTRGQWHITFHLQVDRQNSQSQKIA